MTTIPADKLDKLIARWQSVQTTLASGTDQETYVRLSREFAELDPIVTTITTLRSTVREVDELKQLIDDPKSDPEMAALAEEERGALEPKIAVLEQQLKVQLLPKDAADEKSAILEVRAGTGGDEAALFAGDLFRMYQRYADRNGWKVACSRRANPRPAATRKSSPTSPARACSRGSNSNRACTASSACPRPKRKGASIPRPRPSPCCPRRKRSTSRSTTRILRIDVYPRERPGRPVGQHHRQRGQDHAPAVRSRRQPAGREVAAQEQGEGDEGAARAALRARARQARRRARPGPPQPDRHAATAPSASAPIISRKAASPTTASALPRISSPTCSRARPRSTRSSTRSSPSTRRRSLRRCRRRPVPDAFLPERSNDLFAPPLRGSRIGEADPRGVAELARPAEPAASPPSLSLPLKGGGDSMLPAPCSIRQAFVETAQRLREAGIETPELDARVLLCHAAGLTHETLYRPCARGAPRR